MTNNFRQGEQLFNNKMDGRIPSANYEHKSSRLRRSGLFRLFYEIRQSIFTLSGLLSTWTLYSNFFKFNFQSTSQKCSCRSPHQNLMPCGLKVIALIFTVRGQTEKAGVGFTKTAQIFLSQSRMITREKFNRQCEKTWHRARFNWIDT